MQACTETARRSVSDGYLFPFWLTIDQQEPVQAVLDLAGLGDATKEPDRLVLHACHAAVCHRGRSIDQQAVVGPRIRRGGEGPKILGGLCIACTQNAYAHVEKHTFEQCAHHWRIHACVWVENLHTYSDILA
jgi:hypothetical protein